MRADLLVVAAACIFLYAVGAMHAHFQNTALRKLALTVPQKTSPVLDPAEFPRTIFVFTDPNITLSCVSKNARGYTTRVFSPVGARDYVAEHCPQLLPAYNTFGPLAYKSDTFRACALYTEGGIYADDDLCIARSYFGIVEASKRGGAILIDDFNTDIMGGFLYLTWRFAQDYDVWNGLMAFRRPGHPLLLCVMEAIARNAAERNTRLGPLFVSGPGVFGNCMHEGIDAVYAGSLRDSGKKAPNFEAIGLDGKTVLMQHFRRERKSAHYSAVKHSNWYT